MQAVNYLRYTAPQGDREESFITAHHLSKGGPAVIRDVASVQAGSLAQDFRLGASVTALIALFGSPFFLLDVGTLRSRLISAGVTTGLAAVPGFWAWRARTQQRRIMDKHNLTTVKSYSSNHQLQLVKQINSSIDKAHPKPGEAIFSPLFFENERFYYEQGLKPYLSAILSKAANAENINRAVQKKAGKVASQLPNFEELADYNDSDLKAALEALSHPDAIMPDECRLQQDQKSGILEYLQDLQILFKLTSQSPFGYLNRYEKIEGELIDLRDIVQRLQKAEGLPGERPKLECELERLPGQPRYNDPAAKKKHKFDVEKPNTYPTAIRLSEKGSALYGNAVSSEYASWRRGRNGALLFTATFAYLCYHIWAMEPDLVYPVRYGIRSSTPEDLRHTWAMGAVPCLAAGLWLLAKNQRELWKIASESPWATTAPTWFQEVGRHHAKDFLREQAAIAGLSAFDQGDHVLTASHFEQLKEWYEQQALANQVPFHKLAEDTTRRTQQLEVVKQIVSKVTASSFGFCSLTHFQFDRLPIEIKEER